MVCIAMRRSLISSSASDVQPTEKEGGGSGLQNKLLPDITRLSTFVRALRTWEEHLFGVTEITYGDVVKNNRSSKADVAFFESLQGHNVLSLALVKRISSLKINILP